MLEPRERQSKGLTRNIPDFLRDREKTGICGFQILIPEFPPGLGALGLPGSFFPAGIPRALDLSLLFALIPLGNFHPFPLLVFHGFFLIWNVPVQQLLGGLGTQFLGIFTKHGKGSSSPEARLGKSKKTPKIPKELKE